MNPFAPLIDSKVPRRAAVINEYMALYYQSHMKAEAERRIKMATDAFDALPEAEKTVDGKPLKRPAALAIRKDTARKFWEVEMESVKAEVLDSIETKKANALAELAELREPPQTPGQYHL